MVPDLLCEPLTHVKLVVVSRVTWGSQSGDPRSGGFWALLLQPCQLITHVGAYFSGLGSVPSVCGSVFMPSPYCCVTTGLFSIRQRDAFGFLLRLSAAFWCSWCFVVPDKS